MASKRLLALSLNNVLKQVCRREHQAVPISVIYPRLGNRDIVGHGINGFPGYEDIPEFPAPAVRFKENTKEIMILREKEKGSWHNLTLQEKKELYRASFRQTYAEINAPTGDWKFVLTLVLGAITTAFWVNYFIKTYVLGPLPESITREWQEKQLERMVRESAGRIEGVSSQWDYENKRWKD